jgi:hypothetical protein
MGGFFICTAWAARPEFKCVYRFFLFTGATVVADRAHETLLALG